MLFLSLNLNLNLSLNLNLNLSLSPLNPLNPGILLLCQAVNPS